MNHIATYLDYNKYEKPYKKWDKEQKKLDLKRKHLLEKKSQSDSDIQYAKKKAKIISDIVVVTDNYSQTKAEDVEAFFQTAEIELVTGLTAFSALPALLPKAARPLTMLAEKLPQAANFVNPVIKHLTNYDNLKVKIGKFNFPASKFISAITTALSAISYVVGMNWIVTNQVDATRRARFEYLNKDLSSASNFAILTDDQEEKVKKLMDESSSKDDEDLINKEIKGLYNEVNNRVNVAGSVKSVQPLIKDNDKHLEEKKKYYDELQKTQENSSKELTSQQILEAEKTKQLYENLLKHVDNASQDSLEKFDQMVHVGYGAIFLGGYLEHFLTEGIVDIVYSALKVNNPVIKKVFSLGIPVLTFYILNKNLACLQNSAIRAVKYKKLKEFAEDKDNYSYFTNDEINEVSDKEVSNKMKKKKGLIQIIREVSQAMNEYDNFQKEEFPKLKEYMKTKKEIKLSEDQLKEAELLKKNTLMVMNKSDDRTMKHLESIETISETILQPIEMATSFVGAILADTVAASVISKKNNLPFNEVKGNLSKFVKNKKMLNMLGAVVAFIPCALLEIYLAHKQRNAYRISCMLTLDEVNNYKHFADYSDKDKYNFDNYFGKRKDSILNKLQSLTKKW